MKRPKYKKLVLGLVVGVASAAIIAPATQASSEHGPLAPWEYALVQRSTATAVVPAGGKYGPLDPWAYAVIHRGSSGSVVPPDVRDHRLVAQLIQEDRRTSQSAFNWGDAGLGASVSVAAVVLLLTAFVLGRRYRSRLNRSGLATS